MRFKICIVLPIAALIFSACQKSGNPITPPPPDPLSSKKTVDSVIFKMEDNPGLPFDITTAIIHDTITAIFPTGISLNNLAPTISFSGKGIIPASKAAQNFSTPVPYVITAQDGSTKKYILNGTFRQLSDTMQLFVSRWTLIKDSVTNNNFTYRNELGYEAYPQPGIYYGVAGDYHEFKTDGKWSMRENGQQYTTNYEILSNGILKCTSLLIDPEADIMVLTNNKLTLQWMATNPSNGGKYYRRIYLEK